MFRLVINIVLVHLLDNTQRGYLTEESTRDELRHLVP